MTSKGQAFYKESNLHDDEGQHVYSYFQSTIVLDIRKKEMGEDTERIR